MALGIRSDIEGTNTSNSLVLDVDGTLAEASGDYLLGLYGLDAADLAGVHGG
jgi:hypothetical protein